MTYRGTHSVALTNSAISVIRWLVVSLAIAAGSPALSQCAYDDYTCISQRAGEERARQQQREEEERRIQQQREVDDYIQMRKDQDEDAKAAKDRAEENRQEVLALKKRPLVPAAQNHLLGLWKPSESDRATSPAIAGDPFSTMLGGLLGGACTFKYADRVEFTPDRWISTGFFGRNDVGPVAYHALNDGVAVLPPQGVHVMMFEVLGPNQIRVRGESCVLNRIDPATAVASQNMASPGVAPTGTRPAGTGPAAAISAATNPKSAMPTARTYPPLDPRSALGRGIALYEDTELQRSLPVLVEASKIDPNDGRSFTYLWAAYHILGMNAEAEAARERAQALDPGFLHSFQLFRPTRR